MKSFLFAIITPPFNDKRNTTEQITGFETLPLFYVLRKQGNTRKPVIMECFWCIPQYGAIKMEDTGVGGRSGEGGVIFDSGTNRNQ